MAGLDPTYELHLRVAGQPHDLTLRCHGEPPSEGDLAGWMQDGRVVGLQVTQTSGQRPHTMMVNFGKVVFAWLRQCRTDQGRS